MIQLEAAEQMANEYSEELKKALARIRELENEIHLLKAANEAAVTLGLEQRDDLWQRIAKAKAILDSGLTEPSWVKVRDALEALEGK